MKCPNKSHKDLKFLAEHSNVNIDKLVLIAREYWATIGTEDYFPTEVYINAKLGKGQYEEHDTAVKSLWQSAYNKPLTFNTRGELDAAYEKALKFFPDSAITFYQGYKNDYILVVKEPVDKVKTSITDFLNKKTYTLQEQADFNLIANGYYRANSERKTGQQYFTFKDGTTVKAPFTPNFQQEDALNFMANFVESKETHMTLSGFAGTGKTSLLEMLAQKMKKQGMPVMFCATTNQAAQVLANRVSKAGFEAKTLHKIFGINVRIDESKDYDVRNTIQDVVDTNIKEGTTVIIDEASMIDEKSYKTINDVAKSKGLKVIYVGDEAQLPPVGEDQISIVFRNDNGNIRKLSIVERTDDNAILKEATNLRSNKPLTGESSFNDEGKGVAYIPKSNKAGLRTIVQKFAPELKKNPNYFRILAFHNDVVGSYNEAVRAALGYTDNKPRVNEPIVGYDNWGEQYDPRTREKTYKFINSGSYKITKVSPNKEVTYPKQLPDGSYATLEVTPIELEDSFGNKQEVNLIDVKHNEANRQTALRLAQEKDRINRAASIAWKSRQKEVYAALKAEMRNIEKFLFVNDDLSIPDNRGKGKKRILQKKVFDFGYAMTVHKSQGSTFTHVMMDDADIQTAKSTRQFSSNFEGEDLNIFGEEEYKGIPASNTEDVGEDWSDLADENAEAPLIQSPQITETPSTEANMRQQLEYVAVSRATDTVTIISNNVKTEDSPLNHIKASTNTTPSTVPQPVAIENTPKPADQMNRKELWEHLESLVEPMGERPVSYTPVGKARQEYIVKDGKVYNKKGEEVHYQGKDMNRILANLAVAEDRAVVVTYRNNDYVVDNHQNITSVKTGDIMKWGPENGDKKTIIQLAEQKFQTLIKNRQNRLSEMVPELMDLLKAQGINVNDKAAMEKFLKENPQWATKIQQAIEENREMQDIKAKAIANGTFMKAPNGKPTNLTERQWLQVRTKAFKKWFGDWEKTAPKALKDLFFTNGEINWDYFEKVINDYHNSQPDSMFAKGRTILATREEKHFTGEKNSLNHTKYVTQSMLKLLEGDFDMDLPFVTIARTSLKNQRELLLLAAMFHDAAKPYRHGDIHGWESADILRDILGANYDNRLAEWAIRHHMPMPFSHKAEFNTSNPEALEVARNIARDAKRLGIDENTAINAFVLINAADIINGRDLSVEDNWAKKAQEAGTNRYGKDISVKNVLTIELNEKVDLLRQAFKDIKNEDLGDAKSNYDTQIRFDYVAYPEGGREDKKLPYLNSVSPQGSSVSKVVDENGEPKVMLRIDDAGKTIMGRGDGGAFFATDNLLVAGSYASDEADLYKGFINLKNPYIVRGESHGFFFEYKGKETTVQEAQPSLIDEGYDGVYFERTWDVGDMADVEPGDDYWANNVAMFNPNQIKSATDNNGMFSTENPNIQMFIGKKARTQFEQSLKKARPDMSDAEIQSTLDFLHSLEDNKENTAYIKTAVRWVANRSITLPQDNVKARQAFDLARKKHIDLQKYNTLGELITAPEMQPKKKEKVPFNPDKAKTFSNKRTVTTEGGRVFTVYDVENTDEGQREVCKALAAHYEMSPWCLSTFTATGEPTESAKNYWHEYEGLKRRIAFENGKPVAFSSDRGTPGRQWLEIDGKEIPVGLRMLDMFGHNMTDGIGSKEFNPETLDHLVKNAYVERNPGYDWVIDDDAYKLTQKGLDAIKEMSSESELEDREAWWDMEDIYPQSSLSDKIVADNKGREVMIHTAEQAAEGLGLLGTPSDIELLVSMQTRGIPLTRENVEEQQAIVRRLEEQDGLTPEYDYDDLAFMQTSEGEIYGFADQKGDLYFDEEKVSPNVQIHEYTHLWDRAVAQRNPKLWKRGIDLMKQTSLWNEVLNDANYGKKWQAVKGITSEKMESLIASEVHSRLTGTQGETLLNRIAKEKGSKGIVAKLKQWILDFWKELKGTFSNWSDEEINKLTLDDFTKMTVRDLVDRVNLKEQQQSDSNYVITNEGIRIPMEKGTTIKLPNSLGGTTITIERIYEDPYEGTKFYGTQYDAKGNRISDITEATSFYNEINGIQVFDASGKDITHTSNQQDIQQAQQPAQQQNTKEIGNYIIDYNTKTVHHKYISTESYKVQDLPRIERLKSVLERAGEQGGEHRIKYYQFKKIDELITKATEERGDYREKATTSLLYKIYGKDLTGVYDYDNSSKELIVNNWVFDLLQVAQESPKEIAGLVDFITDKYDEESTGIEVAIKDYSDIITGINSIKNSQQSAQQPVSFTESTGGYPQRTRENAEWSDITLDLTETNKGSGGANELTDAGRQNVVPSETESFVPYPVQLDNLGIETGERLIQIDQQWKEEKLRGLDIKLGEATTDQEKKDIIFRMKKIQNATSEEDYNGNLTKQEVVTLEKKLGTLGQINAQIRKIQDSNRLSKSEISHVAELAINAVSDFVSDIQKNPELVKEWFPNLKTELDFKTATRKEIIQTITLDRLLDKAKELFNSEEVDFDPSTALQADLIYDNFKGIVQFGVHVFAMNEGFGIKKNYKTDSYEIVEGQKLDTDDFNKSQDTETTEETEGDEQEHWQIEQKTLEILNTATQLVRMAIHDCYQLDKNGNPIVSKWHIKERMDPHEAVYSILAWTRGALTLPDMIDRLSKKQSTYKWLQQLTERLNDKSGKEADFQSQFFNTMCKSHQRYSITQLKDGKLITHAVNEHPSQTEIMNNIRTQFNMGEHPLFIDEKGNNGKINKSLLGNERTKLSNDFNLYKAHYELSKLTDKLSKDKELTDEEFELAKDNIIAVCRTLGFIPAEEIIEQVINKENLVGNGDTNLGMVKYLEFIIQSLNKQLNSSSTAEYKPFDFKSDNDISGTLQNFLKPITELMDEVVPNMVYEDGKMYQQYVTPSYLSLLIEKFHWDRKNVESFLDRVYGKSEWFKSKKYGWRGGWVEQLRRDQKSRDIIAHTTELNFNKKRYMKTMSPEEYTLSVLSNYWAENSSDTDTMVPAWFRIPIQSNKPSNEYIRFWSYRGAGYKDTILHGGYNKITSAVRPGGIYAIYLQELDRIDTVRKRNMKKGDPGFIKNFDTLGREFNYLPFLNDYLRNSKGGKLFAEAEKNEKLSKLLQRKVAAETALSAEEEATLMTLVQDAIKTHLDQVVEQQLAEWEKNGIMEAVKGIEGIGTDEATIRSNLENFIWNDHYAALNILEMTIGDIACYKDAEDLQKRLAQLHAPGIRANINATDYGDPEKGIEAKRVSDGIYRTLVLKDFDSFISNIVDNLNVVFDRKIAAARDAAEKTFWKNLKHRLTRPRTYNEDGTVKDQGGDYWNINVADAQGFSSPSSYRKKALMFGRWSRKAENIYQKLRNGDYRFDELEVAFQPLKPFVYGQLQKNMGVDKAPIQTMPIPFQAKNAEYLLIMADALLQKENTGKPNLLRAVYNIMEDSETNFPTKGIDTVQFESAIKSGLQTPIDLNWLLDKEGGEQGAYALMNNLMYKVNEDGDLAYNTDTCVYELPYENYCLQQEVPAHFKNHQQSQGSQERMIIPSDLEFADKEKARQYRKEIEEVTAENINISIRELREELKLGSGDKRQQNLALSEILQREILDSSRYGIDMFLACGINEQTGDFVIPKGDPIQAKRIEQLINSLIKNRINKQEIAGGPIVQVSNYGTSRQLHIKFKDRDGKTLLTREEFDNKLKGEAVKITYKDYEDYLQKNQAGIEYFEVFAPIWAKDIFKKFADKDGIIDVGAIELLAPELLKMISYRIPTEDKYSIAPMKVVGFLPKEAGDAIMFPYELTGIDDSDFDVDKRYVMRWDYQIASRVEPKENETMQEAEKSYIEHNRKSIVEELAINLTAKATPSEIEEIKEKVNAEADFKTRAATRTHNERLEAIDRRNAIADDVLTGVKFSNNEEKDEEIYDKKVEKLEKQYKKDVAEEEQNYQEKLATIEQERTDKLSEKIAELKRQKVEDRINKFLKEDIYENSSQDDALTRAIRKAYLNYMYKVVPNPDKRVQNNNRILDLTWDVLTDESTAHQLLNPGGFEDWKNAGYKIAAYKANNEASWDSLKEKDSDSLKKMFKKNMDLTFIGSQIQFYKQNAAAASLLGIFAVNKIAHATLESDGILIDVSEFCGDEPFTIAGFEFKNRMEVDPRYDKNGKLVGKTLGSGVGASADAAKDPFLDLINVNLSTINVMTTMLRLGMPFENAALFLSQNVITDVIEEFNRANLNGWQSLDAIIQKRLADISEKHSITEDANINTEELSEQELIENLRNNSDDKEVIDYKILKNFQRLQSLAEGMRNPTFATRFNSVSSAVGPLIIDNLILENKRDNFIQGKKKSTGFYTHDGQVVDINWIFEKHPVLKAFSQTLDMAEGLFRDMPAGSTGFRNLLNRIPDSTKRKIFSNKDLFNELSNFYQSHMLVNAGMVEPDKTVEHNGKKMSTLKYYIEEFPKDFVHNKYKEKYPDNPFVQNVTYTTSNKTGRTFLNVNVVGESQTKKDLYSSGLIDLYKDNPDLALDLFNYFLFRGGINFTPKTAMGLFPTYVKEHLSTTKQDGTKVSYVDVYRKMESSAPDIIFDQFMRNNWNEGRLVPKKKGKFQIAYENDKPVRLIAYTKEDLAELEDVDYMRVVIDKKTYLWKLLGDKTDRENQNRKVFTVTTPLGDNNEYLEMSTENIEKPMSDTTLDIEDASLNDLQQESPANPDMSVPKDPKVSDEQLAMSMDDFVNGIINWSQTTSRPYNKEGAEKINTAIKGSPKTFDTLIQAVLESMGVHRNKEAAVEFYKKLC